jgi:DNA-binding protein H-NS
MEYAKKIAEINKLQKEAEKLRKAETDKAIKSIRDLMKVYNLSLDDLRSLTARKTIAKGTKSSAKAKVRRVNPKRPVAPKYGDGHGNLWSGRGKMPVWLRAQIEDGKSLDSFKLTTVQA